MAEGNGCHYNKAAFAQRLLKELGLITMIEGSPYLAMNERSDLKSSQSQKNTVGS